MGRFVGRAGRDLAGPAERGEVATLVHPQSRVHECQCGSSTAAAQNPVTSGGAYYERGLDAEAAGAGDGPAQSCDTCEFVTLIGPGGCGKSTLFNIVAGVDEPTSGGVAIDGDTQGKHADKTGYMPQHPCFYPGIPSRKMSCWDRISAMPRASSRSKRHGNYSKAKLQSRVI